MFFASPLRQRLRVFPAGRHARRFMFSAQSTACPYALDQESVRNSTTATGCNALSKPGAKTVEALKHLHADGPNYYVKLTMKNRHLTVTKDDVIVTHRLKGPLVGDILRMTQVRELGSPNFTLKGSPFVDPQYFVVRTRVLSHTYGKEVAARRGKQRKGHRKRIVISPHITTLKVLEISVNKALVH